MNKHKRQFTIRELLTQKRVSSQEDLVKALKQAGIDITQATLSRDLNEMGIARMSTPDGPRYVSQEADDQRVRALVSYEITSIQHNECLIVVKTLAGRAQGVAQLIDSMNSPHILGTLAGDNTIFITPRSLKEIPRLIKELRAYITTV